MTTLRACALMLLATLTSAFFIPFLLVLKLAEGVYDGVAIWKSCCESVWLGRKE